MTIAWSQLHICKHTLASIYGDTVVVVVMQVANQSHQSVQVPCFRLVPEKKTRSSPSPTQKFHENIVLIGNQLALTTRLDERSPAVAIFSLSLKIRNTVVTLRDWDAHPVRSPRAHTIHDDDEDWKH